MIADLDGEDLSGLNCLELARKMTCALLYFTKCARYFPLRVKNGGALAIFFARLFPRLENRVV
jgi:hypothetical protein